MCYRKINTGLPVILKLDLEKQAIFSEFEYIDPKDFEKEQNEEIPVDWFISFFQFETVIGNSQSISFNKALLDCNDNEIYRQPIIKNYLELRLAQVKTFL